MSSEEIIYVVTLFTNHQVGELLDEMLPVLELYPTSYFDRDEDVARMGLYYETEAERDAAHEKIQQGLSDWADFIDVDEIDVIPSEMIREDWSETWKKFFHTTKVSDRLVIKPSWEEYESTDETEVVLEIDPGMSFGTGNHGTTKACLQFIDKACALGKVEKFLDAGCGSGILSMAAVRLGCETVDAFDYDPEAVACTKENLDKMGFANDVNIFQDDLTTLELNQKYQVLVANILASVLLGCVDQLMAHLEEGPNARLILAGILTEQYPEIKTTFEAAGLVEVESAQIDEWTSGVFKRA